MSWCYTNLIEIHIIIIPQNFLFNESEAYPRQRKKLYVKILNTRKIKKKSFLRKWDVSKRLKVLNTFARNHMNFDI